MTLQIQSDLMDYEGKTTSIGPQEFCSTKADGLTRETASSSSSLLGERTAPETTDGLRRGWKVKRDPGDVVMDSDGCCEKQKPVWNVWKTRLFCRNSGCTSSKKGVLHLTKTKNGEGCSESKQKQRTSKKTIISNLQVSIKSPWTARRRAVQTAFSMLWSPGPKPWSVPSAAAAACAACRRRPQRMWQPWQPNNRCWGWKVALVVLDGKVAQILLWK